MEKRLDISYLDDERFSTLLRNIAKETRTEKLTCFPERYPLTDVIKKAFRKSTERKAKGRLLTEAEIWLTDNYHLVYGYNETDRRAEYPGDKEPRILSIARAIVFNSKNRLDKDRLDYAMRVVSQEVSLSIKELKDFRRALRYAIEEGLYVVAQRILFNRKTEKSVINCRRFRSDMITSDVYLYHACANPDIREETEDCLTRLGLDKKSVEGNYYASIYSTDSMAAYLFGALMRLKEIFCLSSLFSALQPYKILAKSQEIPESSEDTVSGLLGIVERMSKKLRLSEKIVAEKVVELSTSMGVTASEILVVYSQSLIKYIKTGKSEISIKKSTIKELLYISVPILTSLIISVILGVFLMDLYAILAFVPLIYAFDALFHKLLPTFGIKVRFTPKLKNEYVDASAKTLIVISELISSKKAFSEALCAANKAYHSNASDNVDVALLIDFPESKEELSQEDKELIDLIDAYCGNIKLFVRKKVYKNGVFIARDRKKGAIEDLATALHSGDYNAFIRHSSVSTPKYLCLLDHDSVLLPSGVLDMVNILSHPANARYDICAPSIAFNLNNVATYYAGAFNSGYEAYPYYSSAYYDLFGRAVFCGKGLVRLSSYVNRLIGELPEGKLLSHDVLEGAILDTMSGGFMLEDVPDSFFADEKRASRWKKGDAECLPYVFLKKLSLSPLYRFIILKSSFSFLSALSLAAMLVLGLFVSPTVGIVATAVAFLPFLGDLIRELHNFFDKKRFRYAFSDALRDYLEILKNYLLIPHNAIKETIVFLSALKSMITGKGLQEWSTFSENSGKKTPDILIPSIVLLTVICVWSYFISNIAFFTAVSYFSQVAVLYLLTELTASKIVSAEVSSSDKEFLLDTARRTYDYFKFIRYAGLPADNYRTDPVKLSDYTSATDIGFAIIAEVSAFGLELIDKSTFLKNVGDILNKISRLKKWKGNLYNWYFITGKPSIKFVSSVDSGNFLAALIVLEEQLKALDCLELVKKTRFLISNTDLKALYDSDRRQFFIGYDATSGKYVGHYDLFCSETRLLSYIYTALYQDSSHWFSLERVYSSAYGNTLLSWSGTAFETMLPSIFLPSPRGSIMNKTERNVLKIQRKNSRKGVFGISECGDLDIDGDGNYKYHAYGIEEQSLRREPNSPIYSPYAAFLFLSTSCKTIKALRKYAEIGQEGRYGFFESVKVGREIKKLHSYMTHHQGMILASVCNALKPRYISDLFLNNDSVSGAMVLLSEKTSTARPEFRRVRKSVKMPKNKIEYYENTDKIEYKNSSFFSSNGQISLLYDSGGNNVFSYKGIRASSILSEYLKEKGGYVFIRKNGGLNTPSHAPFYDRRVRYSTVKDSRAYYHNETNKSESVVFKCDFLDARIIKVRQKGKKSDDVRMSFYEPVFLATIDEIYAQLPYKRTLISSEWIEEFQALVFKSSSPDFKRDIYYAVTPQGLSDIRYSTDELSVYGRHSRFSDAEFLQNDFIPDGKCGAVLNPCAYISGRPEYDGEFFECAFISTFSEDLDGLLKNLSVIHSAEKGFFDYCSGVETVDNKLKYDFLKAFSTMIPSDSLDKTAFFGNIEEYNKISRGLPIVHFGFDGDLSKLSAIIDALKVARNFGYDCRLSVYAHNMDRIRQKLSSFFNEKAFGSFLLSDKDYSDYAHVVVDADLKLSYRDFEYSHDSETVIYPDNKPIKGEKIGCGYFDDDGNYVCVPPTPLPYSDVIAEEKGGFIATESGGGYTFSSNSREEKITEFISDPVRDVPFEEILLDSVKTYRLNSGIFTVKRGECSYLAEFPDFSSTTEMFLIDNGMTKVVKVSLSETADARLIFRFSPSLDWKADKSFITSTASGDTMRVLNIKTNRSVLYRAIATDFGEIRFSDRNVRPRISVSLPDSATTVYFVIGSDEPSILSLTPDLIEKKRRISVEKFQNINGISIKTSDEKLDKIFRFLDYQTYSSRLKGRLGYYQVGGAVGFRDQLQDAVALRYNSPEILRALILECASHQYVEGDVQHWWHTPTFGVRTKISDDKLFLPYAVAEYIETTGDYAILDEKIPFLSSAALSFDETDRVESPSFTSESYPLIEHLKRAIKCSLKKGDHGLLVIGTGDWNDSLNAVGKSGMGESVVTTLLAIIAIKKLKSFLPDKERMELYSLERRLSEMVNKKAFSLDRYFRLVTDDGNVEGCADSRHIKLDIVPQALAVLSDVADPDRAKIVQDAVEKNLIDDEYKLIKLLTPYQKSPRIGYISAYPDGVRENGGQYTHAAIWYIMALIKGGEYDRAYELASSINPVYRYSDEKLSSLYMGEPYVVAADIYSGDHPGRVGWTWYTGSAGWYYRLIIEGFFGLKKHGKYLSIRPCLPKKLSSATIDYRFGSGKYIIKFQRTGLRRIIFDGIEIRGDDDIPLIDGKTVLVKVEY